MIGAFNFFKDDTVLYNQPPFVNTG